MADITVFVDESGTLPDPKDRVIVVAAVGTDSPERLDLLFKQLFKRGKLRKLTGEIKFYTSGDKTKTAFFEKIAKEDLAIFVLTVEKMGRKIPDTPQHFAILCWLLLDDVLNLYQNVTSIIFDRHFSADDDIDRFNKTLTELMNKKVVLKHVKSNQERRVNVADMIAGAVLAKETGKTARFYELIEKEIISTKSLNWVEAKKRFFNKKLA